MPLTKAPKFSNIFCRYWESWITKFPKFFIFAKARFSSLIRRVAERSWSFISWIRCTDFSICILAAMAFCRCWWTDRETDLPLFTYIHKSPRPVPVEGHRHLFWFEVGKSYVSVVGAAPKCPSETAVFCYFHTWNASIRFHCATLWRIFIGVDIKLSDNGRTLTVTVSG